MAAVIAVASVCLFAGCAIGYAAGTNTPDPDKKPAAAASTPPTTAPEVIAAESTEPTPSATPETPTATPTKKPAPKPTKRPAPQRTTTKSAPRTDPRFRTCAEANAAGYGPYHRGDPEYDWYIDRDHDGVTCES